MNKIIIVGRLTKDPELKTVKIGETETKVCNFTVAVNDRNHAGQETTTYFRVAAWRGLADVCAQYLAKGRQVMVTGKVRLDTYTVSGNIYNQMAISADEVEFLGSGSGNSAAPADAPAPVTAPETDDDEFLGL